MSIKETIRLIKNTPFPELVEEFRSRVMAIRCILEGKPTVFRVSLENVDLEVPEGEFGAGLFQYAEDNVRAFERQDGKTYLTVRSPVVVQNAER